MFHRLRGGRSGLRRHSFPQAVAEGIIASYRQIVPSRLIPSLMPSSSHLGRLRNQHTAAAAAAAL